MELFLPIAGGIVLLIVLVAILARAPNDALAIPVGPRSEADALRNYGLPGKGKVIFMQPTGKVVDGGREFHVTVEVLPETGGTYRVDLVSVVPPSEEHRVVIGHQIPIRIHRKKRTDVVIDL
ncbi:MAG: hypothetical protein U0235_26425 [Polyangiaceae bacterium]